MEDSDSSESPPSQVFKSAKKRVLINYDEKHSVTVTPPTSSLNTRSMTKAGNIRQTTDEDLPSSLLQPSTSKPQPVRAHHEDEDDNEERQSEKPKKVKIKASSSTKFLPETKQTRQTLQWSQVDTFTSVEEFEQSDIFKKLKWVLFVD